MRAVGIILAGGKNEKLYPLTARRATSAIPVAASYRAIDFSLSNMSNSGITKIAVITQYNSRSLHDHMNSAKWWNIGRKQGGLFVFTPYMTNDNSGWFRGTADSMYQNISFLRRSHEEYVIIANGDGVYKMDYEKVLEQHIKNKADVTVVTKTFDESMDTSPYGNIVVDDDGRIIEFEEKPLEKLSNTISIGVYVIKRELLIDMLEEVVRDGRYDFVTDVIIRYRKRLKMMSYDFDGYWKTLNSLENYYSINMDFLNLELRKELLYKEPYIYTKSKDEPPAKYNYTSRVCNSLVGNGTIINGNIEDSVIFRKVVAEKDSTIRHSVILEGAVIGNNCIVEYAIIDKNMVLPAGTVINGTPDKIKVVSEKNFSIGKNKTYEGAIKVDITNVNLRLSRKDSVVKGIASITIDDCFVIHDLKILEGESGLFIAMPSKKMQDGTYRDVAHPINRETRKYVESVIIDEYNKMLKDEAEVIGSV